MTRPRTPTDKSRQTICQLEYWLDKISDVGADKRPLEHRLMHKAVNLEKQLLEDLHKIQATN